MTPERARQIALACADSWYGGAAGMNLKEAITQGIMEALAEDARGKEKLDALRIALGAPEPTQEQEPVDNDTISRLRALAIAVLADRLYILGSDQWADPELVARWNAEATPATILQLTRAHPAPAQTPMSDDQIMDVARESCGGMRWPSTPIALKESK